jgi:hypothetical protein
MWPQFNFANPSLDINGDGDFTDTETNPADPVALPNPITLTQGECLVFFLGGINGNTVPGSASADNNIPLQIGACTGFSKNLANPFARGGNREAPLFDFLPARFSDLDADGFPEYLDPLPNQTKPYLYYSVYDGTAYQSAEFFAASLSDPDQTGSADRTRTGLSEPYRTGTALAAPLWKPNSYQIISPGYDKAYGFGGAYLPSGTDRLDFDATFYTGATPASLVPPTGDQRMRESDNITNFSPAELQP